MTDPRSRAGFTAIELSVALVITMIAASMLSAIVLSSTRARSANHEMALAARAARNVVERMNNQDFFDLFALYNPDPADDPDGVGTAPGNLFDVPGLTPPVGEEAVGRIVFPVVAPPGAPEAWQLREDVENRRLGMPRDLDQDGQVDAADHAADYSILPILVDLAWEGKTGRRTYRIYTILSEVRL